VPEGLTDPDLADLDRVFMRDNPSGPALEAWFHQAGCRRWAHLERDRTTDQWL
jgi:sarcosine oxidase delta subunit